MIYHILSLEEQFYCCLIKIKQKKILKGFATRYGTKLLHEEEGGGNPQKLLLLCMVVVSETKTGKNLCLRDGGLHLFVLLNSHLRRYMIVSWTEM